MMNKMERTAPRQDVHCTHRNNRVNRSGGRGSCRAESARQSVAELARVWLGEVPLRPNSREFG